MKVSLRALLISILTKTLGFLLALHTEYGNAQISQTQNSFHKSFYFATHTNPNGLHLWVFKIGLSDTSDVNKVITSLTKKFGLLDCKLQFPNTTRTEFLVSIQNQFTNESLNHFLNQLQPYLKKHELLLVDFGIYTAEEELIWAKTIQSPFYGASIIHISGQIVDRFGSGIAYATIGLPDKLLGAISNEYGKFSLSIPAQFISDTLMVVALGYDTACIALEPELSNNLVIYLKDNNWENEFVLTTRKRHKMKPVQIAFTEAQKNILIPSETAGFQIAKLFSFNQAVLITRVAVYIKKSSNLNTKLRLRLYQYNKPLGLPGKELLSENLIAEVENGYLGWVVFNLELNPIYTDEPIIAGIELLDKSENPFHFGAYKKPISKCFELYHALGIWIPTQDYSWAISVKIIRL